MENKQSSSSIDSFIEDVSSLLPYPRSRKEEVLEELAVDLQAAIKDSNETDPTSVYGSVREVATNLSKNLDWGTKPAGWWSRALAFLIDAILVVSACFAYLVLGLVVFFGIDIAQLNTWSEFSQIADNFFSNLDVVTALVLAILALIYCLVAVLFYCTYFVVLEMKYSMTIGKKVLGLQVVDVSGIKITWKQSFVRNFTKFPGIVEFLPFDVILGMLQAENGQGEYQRAVDMLAKTLVVKRK